MYRELLQEHVSRCSVICNESSANGWSVSPGAFVAASDDSAEGSGGLTVI